MTLEPVGNENIIGNVVKRRKMGKILDLLAYERIVFFMPTGPFYYTVIFCIFVRSEKSYALRLGLFTSAVLIDNRIAGIEIL